MKKLLLLAVSLAFIASIGIGGTLAFRTYIIASPTFTDAAALSADQSSAPLAVQVSNGGTLADFNFRAKGVQPLGSVSDASTSPDTPAGACISIKQHTLQRNADGSLAELTSSEASPAKQTILTQLLPSPAFKCGDTPAKTEHYWNNVGAVDHVIMVSYSYTPASDAAPTASIRTIFAFPNPTLGSGSPFMDSIYLNWLDESKLASLEGGRKYADLSIDDLPYRIYVYSYEPVASGSTTQPSLLQLAMDAAITNEDIAALQPYDGFAVRIVSQAITSDAGAAAKAAVFYDVNQAQHPWSAA